MWLVTNMLFAVAALIACLVVLFSLWHRRRQYWLAWQLDGPFAWPLIGNLWFFAKSIDVVIRSIDLSDRCSKLYRLWLGPHLVIFLNHPETIQELLSCPQASDKGYMYRLFSIVLGGEGLISSAGETWNQHRMFLNPTMQYFTLLKTFQPLFNKHSRELVKRLDSFVDMEIDIYKFIESCSLDMLCETTFGTPPKGQLPENTRFIEAANSILNIAGRFCTRPWYNIPLIFKLSQDYKILESSRSLARGYASKIVHEKMERYKSNSSPTKAASSDSEADFDSRQIKNNFIDECLRLSIEMQSFTKEDLINESITMLLSGFETTGVTVSYIVLMLAMYPDYQQKVFEEIQSIFPDQTSDVSIAELTQLKYTDQFIKETMRLHPAVPYMSRKVHCDLKIDNYVVPAGTEVAVAIMPMHWNKTVWGPNARDFDPDNFLPDKVKARHPYAYLPFSAGPRNCIGYRYAHIVVRFIVCWLVRNYRFSTEMRLDDLQYLMSITLKLGTGHMVKVHRRTKN